RTDPSHWSDERDLDRDLDPSDYASVGSGGARGPSVARESTLAVAAASPMRSAPHARSRSRLSWRARRSPSNRSESYTSRRLTCSTPDTDAAHVTTLAIVSPGSMAPASTAASIPTR